jgi:hypothetical protein
MAYNFLACDRDQAFLLPPDLRDWLPADHLAWFVLDVVDQVDLHPFLAAYRADGHGRAAYQPRMLLGVLLYAYCTGIRSSPGQPWVMSSGRASGSGERTCRKCTVWPSMVVVNCGNSLSRCSWARQS